MKEDWSHLGELHESYVLAQPFPHIVLDEFLEPETAMLAGKEFPPVSREWLAHVHVNERKYSHTEPDTWGPTLKRILNNLQSDEFVTNLSQLTGIEGLISDPELAGGGLHQSMSGGYLNVHADFTVHPHHRTWRRRVNLLLYLNDEWPEAYGGGLELWSRDMSRREKVIAPVGNRVVIFSTDPDSFHGHPDPLQCPPDVARKSLALYYFTKEDRPFVRSTEYRARPGESGWAVWADKQALRVYDRMKRTFGISDTTASRVLRWLDRRRN